MLITWTCTYTNMRMSVESGVGLHRILNLIIYIMHIDVVMASRDEVDQLLFESVVRGYHVCETVWTTFVGEILTVGPETADRHAVCLKKDAQIVGPVPRTSSPSSRHFLDAQRTGNLCIKRCIVHFVILAHALNKYCAIPFSYHAPRVCANKPGALINQTLQYLQLHSVELFYIPHLSSNVEEFTLIQL